MEKVLKGTQLEILILDNLNMEKLMAKEFTHGKMEKYTMENGIRE